MYKLLKVLLPIIIVFSVHPATLSTPKKKKKKLHHNANCPIIGLYYRDYLDAMDTIKQLHASLATKDTIIKKIKAKQFDRSNDEYRDSVYEGLMIDSYLASIKADSFNKILNRYIIPKLQNIVKNFQNKGISIKFNKAAIFVDIENNVLFESADYNVADDYKDVLHKIANLLLEYPTIEFMIEGNTDNVKYSKGELVDNWDLSVKRATSVARIFIGFGIVPNRIIAAGKGEYNPVNPKSNQNLPEVRQQNRRTSIIILPNIHDLDYTKKNNR